MHTASHETPIYLGVSLSHWSRTPTSGGYDFEDTILKLASVGAALCGRALRLRLALCARATRCLRHGRICNQSIPGALC